MKKIILIESAEELFNFACPYRQEGDNTPDLPSSAALAFESGTDIVRLEQAPGFQLSPDITASQVLTEAFKRNNLKVRII